VMQKKCQHSEELLTKLAHNYGLALENIQEHLLEPWLREAEWKKFDVCTVDANTVWQAFYNNIKDSGWPRCDTQAEFELLPDWIQDEIVTVHWQHK